MSFDLVKEKKTFDKNRTVSDFITPQLKGVLLKMDEQVSDEEEEIFERERTITILNK